MSAYRDPELDGLGDEQGWDPEMRDLAHFLRASSRAYSHIEPSPQFRRDLRRRLMRAAWEQAARPPAPWYRRFLTPQPMAMAGAAIGAVLIVAVAFLSLGPQQHDNVNVAVHSPQQDAQNLAPAVTPIQLQFSTPMQTDSVQLQIQPATLITKDWDTQHRVLTITPVNGLSANTQYKVTVTSARTAQSQQVPVATIRPVVFSTGPMPTPTPSQGPRPTTPPSPILSPHDITSVASGSRVHWSIDGSSLYVISSTGTLEQVSLSGGTPQKLADGVSLAAVAPDGSSVAWLSGGQVTWKSTIVSNVQPIALGFRASGLLMASVADVETADQKRVAGFKETASAADFSSVGDHVAYLGASGLHLVDLATGRDTTIGPATGLGAWSSDGQHYAYPTSAGVSVANVVEGSSARLVDLAGVNGLSWSRGGQILLSAAGALYLVDYGSTGPATAVRLTTAQEGTFATPDWAPNGSGQFSFIRGSDVWVARVQGAAPGPPLITPVTPGVTQDDLVNSFMTARQRALTDQALSFLDAAGRDAFSHLSLVYTDPILARYYVLFSQPGRVVVRLVLTHGVVQTAVDETLGIQPDANNHQFIHSVTENPRQSFGTGPEVVHVVVTPAQVQVTFDSDLDPNSAVQGGAVAIKGVTTTATYDRSSRTVTLTVPGGLTGTTFDLSIGPSLVDLSQRPAVQYDLTFTG
ncbi:MAG TPA: Ig-like domain-containing protein [Terriglobales bacterium]|nr:Ig-like domain-containing protein [Terriglobales bacterium]